MTSSQDDNKKLNETLDVDNEKTDELIDAGKGDTESENSVQEAEKSENTSAKTETLSLEEKIAANNALVESKQDNTSEDKKGEKAVPQTSDEEKKEDLKDDKKDDVASSEDKKEENKEEPKKDSKEEKASDSKKDSEDKKKSDEKKSTPTARKSAKKDSVKPVDKKKEAEQAKRKKMAEKKAKAAAKEKKKLEKKRAKNIKAREKRKAHDRKKKQGAGGDTRRNVWLLILTTCLIAGAVFMFTPPDQKITQGLDIRGGLSVVLKASTTDGSSVTTDQMETSRSIIESRVNALGATEATVQVQGTDQILVQIPGLDDTQTALNTIGKTGQLEFARLDSFTDEDVKTKIDEGNYGDTATNSDDYGNSFKKENPDNLEVESGTYTPMITGSNISKVTVDKASQTSQYYAVNLELDSTGKQAFADATKELASSNGKIVIILDNQVNSAPAVQSEITDGKVSITGNYSMDDAKSLQTVLESGSLPVSFSYSTSQVVGPTLGQDALYGALIVVIIGLALVMLYLLFFYKGLGIITAAAMIVFAAFYLGILATLSAFGMFSLSLAGLAGIVLTIGMAADSSVLTVERFREEIRMGKSIRSASITGVKHAILTSIDADLVSMVSALSLFFLASATVKGFGLTLSLGIICDIVMMVLFKAPLIRLMAPRTIKKHPGFWNVKDCLDAAEIERDIEEHEADEPQSYAVNAAKKVKGRFIKRDINFVGYKKVFLSISAVAVVVLVGFMVIKGFNWGVEFVGGSSITFTDAKGTSTEDMRAAFEEAGVENPTIQTANTSGTEGFIVRIATTDSEEANNIATTVQDKFGLDSENTNVDVIGPDWGTSVIQSSLIAFFVSLFLIICYVAIRFEWKMGVVAVVTLLHDLIIVMGVYAIVGREVNPNTIAALLTILGYSLYDTIVTFHRVNDNMKAEDIRCTFGTMANHSINQVLIRTLNTTITSFVPVFFMLFFGGETLKDFAFAMSIGLIAGSYSSFAVAVPIYVIWKTHEPRNAKLQQKYGDEIARFSFDASYRGGLVQVPLSRLEAEKKAQAAAGEGADVAAGAKAADTQAAKKASKGRGSHKSQSDKKSAKPIKRPQKK